MNGERAVVERNGRIVVWMNAMSGSAKVVWRGARRQRTLRRGRELEVRRGGVKEKKLFRVANRRRRSDHASVGNLLRLAGLHTSVCLLQEYNTLGVNVFQHGRELALGNRRAIVPDPIDVPRGKAERRALIQLKQSIGQWREAGCWRGPPK